MIHVHARDPHGKNSGDLKAIYAEIIREIRARSPILIQTTNGIGVRRDPATGQFIWPTDSERLGLLDLEPHAATCSASQRVRPTSTTPRAATPKRRPT